MRTFTIDEAEKVLPKVGRVMRKAQRLRDKIAWIIEANDATLEITTDAGFHYFMTDQVHINKEFHRLYYQFYRTIEELNKLGAIVRDIDDGVIDFPCRLNNRDAFFSWHVGDDRIRYWHDAQVDFEERRPIVDLDEFL